MDDWAKIIITIIVAVTFVSVMVGITQPSVSTLSNKQDLVSCTLDTWCYTTQDNLVSIVITNHTDGKVLATVAASGATEDYIPDLAKGRVNITNVTGTGTFNLSYTYYPDAYDTGASGSTTRSVAALLPAGFVLLILVMVFSTAIMLYRKQ